MILCLDVGNSQIFAGLFDGENILLRFRYSSKDVRTSDQIGIFLRCVLKENGFESSLIKQIVIGSVVPFIDYSLRAACLKYFKIEPFILKAGLKTGIKVATKNPTEVGADLIATAVASVADYPDKNIIVVDFGTATTITTITANGEFLGGLFFPGMMLSMNALQQAGAQLPPVEIVKPKNIVGFSTVECIQSGLYYGQLGVIHEAMRRITDEYFDGQQSIVIGTGGFSYLFEDENIFTAIDPDLVLRGLRLVMLLNI